MTEEVVNIDIKENLKLFDKKKLKQEPISTMSDIVSEDSEWNEVPDLNRKDSHTREIDKLLNEASDKKDLAKVGNRFKNRNPTYKTYKPYVKSKETPSNDKNKDRLGRYSRLKDHDSDFDTDSDSESIKTGASEGEISEMDEFDKDDYEGKRKRYKDTFGSEELELKRKFIIQINRFRKFQDNIQDVNLKMPIEDLQLILDSLIDTQAYERKRRNFRIFIKGCAFLVESVLLKTGYCNSLEGWYHNVVQNIDDYNPFFDEMIKPTFRRSKKTGKVKIVQKTNIVTLMSSNGSVGLIFQLGCNAVMYAMANYMYTGDTVPDNDEDDDMDDDKYFNETFQE